MSKVLSKDHNNMAYNTKPIKYKAAPNEFAFCLCSLHCTFRVIATSADKNGSVDNFVTFAPDNEQEISRTLRREIDTELFNQLWVCGAQASQTRMLFAKGSCKSCEGWGMNSSPFLETGKSGRRPTGFWRDRITAKSDEWTETNSCSFLTDYAHYFLDDFKNEADPIPNVAVPLVRASIGHIPDKLINQKPCPP